MKEKRLSPQGLTNHPEYFNMAAVKRRCLSPKCPDYKNYGGRGITLYEPWAKSSKEMLEWIDGNLGPRPKGFTLDRIDNEKGYEPGNLQWASPLAQSRNQRRHMAVERVTYLEGILRQHGIAF